MNNPQIRPKRPGFIAQIKDPRFRTSVTMTVIIILISGIQFLTGVQESVLAAALVKPLVRQGQLWRLITCAFLHGSILHIGFNAYALYNIGRFLEVLTNRAILLTVYFASVICGSLFSVYFMPDSASLGASGGILGLFGCLGVLAYKYRKVMPPGFLKSILHNLAIIALIGFVGQSFIDNASHAGGLIAGAVTGWILIPSQQGLPVRSSKLMNHLGSVLWVVYFLFGLFTLVMIGLVHAYYV